MPGQPMPGQPMPGQPMLQAEQPSQQSQENPARKLLEQALERMREAQQRLEEAKREESLAEQDKAIEALIKAKAELEEILRQMREEEVGRMLTLLESRFRKMLEAELRVYESTKRMDRLPEEQRGREFAIQANNLSNDQRKIAIEADKALLLLQEEGSSVAFPETVEQLRDEMNLVAERLASLKVGLLTQESQEEIIAVLEELIAALQKAQQEQEQRQQQQQSQQPMEPGEQPLVDGLAELKMIRSLQMRINTRTQRYARLLVDRDDPVGEVTDDDLRDQLRHLGNREANVFDITRDLILGKNK
jgi:HEPN domain-containing protein